MWHELPDGTFRKCQAGLAWGTEGNVFHCEICAAEGECRCGECRAKLEEKPDADHG